MSAVLATNDQGLIFISEVEAKFELWLDEAIDFDPRGNIVTRRMQMLLSDCPNLCLHWAKVGFAFGAKRIGDPNPVAQTMERGRNCVEVTSHGRIGNTR